MDASDLNTSITPPLATVIPPAECAGSAPSSCVCVCGGVCGCARLLAQVGELKRRQASLVVELEREEELLTNTLSKRILSLERDKARLVCAYEAEQEEVCNRLQRVVESLSREKAQLQVRVASEASALEALRSRTAAAEESHALALARMREALRAAAVDRVACEALREVEAEALVNKLTRQLKFVTGEREDALRQVEVVREGVTRLKQGVKSNDAVTALEQVEALLVRRPQSRGSSTPHRSAAAVEAGAAAPTSPRATHTWSAFVSSAAASAPRPQPSSDETVVVLTHGEYTDLTRALTAARNEAFLLAAKLSEERERAAAYTATLARFNCDVEVGSERVFNGTGTGTAVTPAARASFGSSVSLSSLCGSHADRDSSIRSASHSFAQAQDAFSRTLRAEEGEDEGDGVGSA